MSDKKKFKDTKVGQFLSNKVPGVARIAGELLPDQGVLGIVKNLVSGSKDLSPADKAEAMRLLLEEEQLYMADRASARLREVELAKAGKMDWMMKVVGLTVLGTFVSVVIAVLFFELKNENLAHLLIGEVLGLVTGLAAYYFGSSKSSNDKTKLLVDRGTA